MKAGSHRQQRRLGLLELHCYDGGFRPHWNGLGLHKGPRKSGLCDGTPCQPGGLLLTFDKEIIQPVARWCSLSFGIVSYTGTHW
ncbi:hypothetical protein [Ammoniphilus sp. 3BR4]|uniref:hypothetical protein n=1 Tax=Ammoniphilus sp. 3BR4 TaxID=3158265 RepID=UPI003466A195